MVGVIFGLLTNDAWGGRGPYRAQISAALWGLVGGVLGLVIGILHRLITGRRAREPSAPQVPK